MFELSPKEGDGYTETVLHSFGRGTDGAFPYAGLIFDAAGSHRHDRVGRYPFLLPLRPPCGLRDGVRDYALASVHVAAHFYLRQEGNRLSVGPADKPRFKTLR